MKINSIFRYVVIIIAMLMTMSCSSVESDAKKAASLINKSIEQSQELEFGKAEKNYLKAQEIMKRYDEDKTVEFYEHFANYRDKEKKQNAN